MYNLCVSRSKFWPLNAKDYTNFRKKRKTHALCVPSNSVLVTTLIWLLACSFPLKEELSWSTDTMSEPECFFLISRSVVCAHRKMQYQSEIQLKRTLKLKLKSMLKSQWTNLQITENLSPKFSNMFASHFLRCVICISNSHGKFS